MVDMSLKSLLIYGFALHSFFYSRTSLVAQMVKCLSTMWETWVRALGWEDPLETEMAIHSSTIAWKVPRRSLVGYSLQGPKSQTRLSDFTFTFKATRKGRNEEHQGQQKERNLKNQGRNKCKRNKRDHSKNQQSQKLVL